MRPFTAICVATSKALWIHIPWSSHECESIWGCYSLFNSSQIICIIKLQVGPSPLMLYQASGTEIETTRMFNLVTIHWNYVSM